MSKELRCKVTTIAQSGLYIPAYILLLSTFDRVRSACLDVHFDLDAASEMRDGNTGHVHSDVRFGEAD